MKLKWLPAAAASALFLLSLTLKVSCNQLLLLHHVVLFMIKPCLPLSNWEDC
jgi:hypothetical protein